MYRYHGVSVFEDIGNILGIDESHHESPLVVKPSDSEIQRFWECSLPNILQALHYPS